MSTADDVFAAIEDHIFDCDAEEVREKIADAVGTSLQARVAPWMLETFGAEVAADELERCDRFVEESLELVQAKGYPRERVLALLDYTYGRPAGDPAQEVGGVMLTLAALCLAAGIDMHEAGEAELARVWTSVDKIRAKQAAKPHGSALPVAVRDTGGDLLRCMELINLLRFEEGNSVDVLCDNPEGPPNNAVEVCADWTDWENRRFEGETLLAALQAAVAAKVAA